jgi:aminoglycoside N3'-acetyltransferase
MTKSAEKETRRVAETIDKVVPAALRTAIAAVLPAGVKDLVKSTIQSRPMRSLNNVLERRADRRYQQGKHMTAAAEIRAAFDHLPLPDHAVVLVHSSMSRLGYVEGGAATVVSALLSAVVEALGGTVAVPTFSMSGGMADTLRAGEIFDVRNTPSGMGRITELIRKHADARRSLHPTHSVSAIGPRASWLVEAHHRDRRSFGPLSPFARLSETNGYVLGLGVDLGPVTFYHVVEDLGPFPIDVYTADSPIAATCLDDRGSRVEMAVMAHDPAVSVTRIDRPSGAAIRAYMTTVLENAAGLTWHEIGDGRMWLVDARRFYHTLVQLKERRITIYASAAEVASLPPPESILWPVLSGPAQ